MEFVEKFVKIQWTGGDLNPGHRRGFTRKNPFFFVHIWQRWTKWNTKS